MTYESALWAEIKETIEIQEMMKPSSSTTDASTRGREAGCPVSGNKVINCCLVLDFIGAKFNIKYRQIKKIKKITCLLVLNF